MFLTRHTPVSSKTATGGLPSNPGWGTFQSLPEFFAVKPDPQDQGEQLGYYREDFDDRAWVTASTWNSLENSGFRDYMHMFYRCDFDLPEADGRSCILRLGAVDKDCKVWVNGQYAGTRQFDAELNPGMWAEPAEFDISELIRSGKRNQLTVKVGSRGGVHGGIWKPSFIRFEIPAHGQPITPVFQLPEFARKIKIGMYDCIVIPGNPSGSVRLQEIQGSLELPELGPGQKYRLRGELNITGLAQGGVDVSLCQYQGKSPVRFDEHKTRGNTDRWEDFSFEAEILPEVDQVIVRLIARNLPSKGQVMFRNIHVEKLTVPEEQ